MDGSVRAALVTGGSSGIGLAIARVLAEEGHALTLAALHQDELDVAQDMLRGDGARVQTVQVNLAEVDGIETVVDAHRAAYGRLDVLVNNAGVGVDAPIDVMAESRIALQFDVNLHAIIRGYRAALPMLRASAREHRNTQVVNTASISARYPEPGLSIYSTAKAAVLGFSRAMNVELGPEGIKSTALAPGMVATPIVEYLHDRVPPEEMIQPQDVAELVRGLLRLGPTCVVEELAIGRPGGSSW